MKHKPNKEHTKPLLIENTLYVSAWNPLNSNNKAILPEISIGYFNIYAQSLFSVIIIGQININCNLQINQILQY